MANETSLFVCVKDSPVSDRWSDSLSVAAFDWASLLLQSFPFRPVSKRTQQFLSKVLGVLIVLWGYGHEYLDLSWLGLGPGKTKRNLGFFSNFNQNTVRCFQAIYRRVLGVLVTWWCFMIFLVIFRGFFPTLQNSPSTTKSPAPLKLFGILLEITWRCYD